VFAADFGNSRVVELPAGGSQITLPFTGLNEPAGVAVDGSGDVFAAGFGNSRVVELPAGGSQITLPFTGLNEPAGVAVDGSGDVFAADAGNNRVVELSPSIPVGSSPPPPPTPSPPPTATATPTPAPTPSLSGLSVYPRKFSLAGRIVGGRCIKPTRQNRSHRPCQRAIRLAISYTLNRAATVTFTLKRMDAGRKLSGRCVKPTRRNNGHRRCTRLINLSGAIARASSAGANGFTFNGNIGGHKLVPGSYQLTGTAAGGSQRSTTFQIRG
jgi:hypothetical protein